MVEFSVPQNPIRKTIFELVKLTYNVLESTAQDGRPNSTVKLTEVGKDRH